MPPNLMWREVEIHSYYAGNYRDRRTPLLFPFRPITSSLLFFLLLSLLPSLLSFTLLSSSTTSPSTLTQTHSLAWVHLAPGFLLTQSLPGTPLIRGALTLRSLHTGLDPVIADPLILHTFVHSRQSTSHILKDIYFFKKISACFCLASVYASAFASQDGPSPISPYPSSPRSTHDIFLVNLNPRPFFHPHLHHLTCLEPIQFQSLHPALRYSPPLRLRLRRRIRHVPDTTSHPDSGHFFARRRDTTRAAGTYFRITAIGRATRHPACGLPSGRRQRARRSDGDSPLLAGL